MVGKGSVNHNSRLFNAQNTDPERTHLNTCLCNENIKDVYIELFEDARLKYNEKQKRADRTIDNYYEKIRSSKQEKLFHEIILQIGDKDNMSSHSDNGLLAEKIMKEYYQNFQQRNPYLRVFSAHIHMDEATPHIHIDFVPFTTDSKRGMETRVSLKQALAKQGFTGKGKSENEWNQWVLSEKQQMAKIMGKYHIEWEQKGTHDKHLSVLEFEKKMRAQEVKQLESDISEKTDTVKLLEKEINEYKNCNIAVRDIEKQFETDPQYILAEPQKLMSAKTYKEKFVLPVVDALKKMIKYLTVRYFEANNDYHRVNQLNGKLYQENRYLRDKINDLSQENDLLRKENKDYRLLRKVFGNKQIDNLLQQARQLKTKDKQQQR